MYLVVGLTIAFAIFCEIVARGSMAIGLAAVVVPSLVGSVVVAQMGSPGGTEVPGLAAVGPAFRGILRLLAAAMIGPAKAKASGSRIVDWGSSLPAADWRHAVVGNVFAATVMAATALMQRDAGLSVWLTLGAFLAIVLQSAFELLPIFASPAHSKTQSAAKDVLDEDKSS